MSLSGGDEGVTLTTTQEVASLINGDAAESALVTVVGGNAMLAEAAERTLTGGGAELNESAITTYAWDVPGRLKSVTAPGGQTHSYDYDYRTRRIGTHQTAQGEQAAKHTVIAFSGGLSLAEYESEETQTTVANPEASTVRYVRGPDMGGGVGGLLYSSRNGTAKYNLSNGRGDVVAQSDASGALTWTASYEAGGKRTKETGTNADKQRANSKDEDPTGLLNEGFRYRDLETMAFINRDPAGFVDGPNLYAYVQQNPWTAFDPDGLATKSEHQWAYDNAKSHRDKLMKTDVSKFTTLQKWAMAAEVLSCDRIMRNSEAGIKRIEATAKHLNDLWATDEFQFDSNELDDEAHQALFNLSDQIKAAKRDVVLEGLSLGLAGLMKGRKGIREGMAALRAAGFQEKVAEAMLRVVKKRVMIGGAYESRGGLLRMGAFDSESGTIALGRGGHFDGAAEAGMAGIKPATHKGLTTFEKDGAVYWANDSMSLPKAITPDEASDIQRFLEAKFKDQSVQHVEQIGDAFK